jgi:hypothetical protein
MDEYELDMMEAENEYLGFSPKESQSSYDPCEHCSGEDCMCCEVYLEMRAEQRGY